MLAFIPSCSLKYKPAICTYIQHREETRGRRKCDYHNTVIREQRGKEGREAQKQRRESEGLNSLACRAHQMSDPPWKKKVNSSTSVSLEHTCKQKCHQLSVRKSDQI